MDVSVVIPLYNGARWIEDTLRSVRAQTHRPREVVVVDDGSDDESQAIVRAAFPEVKVLRSPGAGGKGAGRARNLGLQHTSAPLVAFLDQDDLWHPDHLRILTRLLHGNDHPAAVAGLDRFRGASTPSYDVRPRTVRAFTPWDRYPLNSIHSPSCVVVRRSALERIGGWPSQFLISDVHAWFKLTATDPMLRTRTVSVGKREHDDSCLQMLRTEKALFYLREHLRVCEDALAFRTTVQPEKEDVFQDRLDTFKIIGRAVEGILEGDTRLLTDAARFLERESRTEQDMVKALWEFVFWLPSSQISATVPSKQRLILERVIRGWPHPCRRARGSLSRVLTQAISYRAFLSYALRKPFQAMTSPLFRACMRIQWDKTSARATRYARAPNDSA